MGDNEREFICYKMLSDVLIGGAYASLALGDAVRDLDERDRCYITELFYGILESNIGLEYLIDRLTNKRPKKSVEILLKMGMYLMRYMSVPPYAAINKTVELAKKVGKGGVSGFINAVLRKSQDLEFPAEGEVERDKYLSVTFGVPLWIVDKLITEYGYEFSKEFFGARLERATHIRRNSRVISKEDFEAKLRDFSASKFGYYVSPTSIKKLDPSEYTIQSLSSMIAVSCYPTDIRAPKVLDVCGAPGGKSIYYEELCSGADITCCDIHPHRVELIKKYALRMRSSVKAMQRDATEFDPRWKEKFDVVLCDVPCSGLGVYKSKPDVLINKKESDIDAITALQAAILRNSSKYVALGGYLCYSTCTILKEENEEMIYDFLKENDCFSADERHGAELMTLLPQCDGCDGFFIARLRRIK